MKTKFFYLGIVSLLFLFSCKENAIKDFENVVEITPADATKWGLPEVNFKFSYPTNDNIKVREAQEGYSNSSYVFIDYFKDESIVEEISLGYCSKCTSITTDEKLDLLQQLADQFDGQLDNFEIISNKDENFDGKNRPVLKFKVKFETDDYGFKAGDYIGIFTIYLPEKGDHGLLYLLLANTKETEIKNFEDFGEKGFLAEIYHTIRFVEE